MAQTISDRRGFLATLAGASGLFWLVAGRDRAAEYKVPHVSIDEAKALLEAGALAVDVRDQEKFAHRHLPDAVLVPLTALRVAVPLTLAAAKTRAIVVYCNKGLAHGPEATQLLFDAGFAQAVNLTSGIEGWAEAGMPVARG